jgi:hypothetical protein
MSAKAKTVRQAARERQPLDGADAQALEGALAITERERDAAEEVATRQRDRAKQAERERDEARLSADAEAMKANNLIASIRQVERERDEAVRLLNMIDRGSSRP